MKVQLSDLRLCLHSATDLAEKYRTHVEHHSFPRSVSDLYWMCEKHLGLKIIRRRLRIAATGSIKAVFIKNDGHYEVHLLQGIVGSEQRLIETKELFHAILDDPKYHSVDLYAHLSEVFATAPSGDAIPNPPAISEYLAEYAAMEFLFPHRQRVLELAKSADPDFAGIADIYGIPQYHVEKYLRPDWMEFVKWP